MACALLEVRMRRDPDQGDGELPAAQCLGQASKLSGNFRSGVGILDIVGIDDCVTHLVIELGSHAFDLPKFGADTTLDDHPPYALWSSESMVEAEPPPIGVPLASLKPISTCGPLEMPTIPGPTSLITCPALT